MDSSARSGDADLDSDGFVGWDHDQRKKSLRGNNRASMETSTALEHNNNNDDDYDDENVNEYVDDEMNMNQQYSDEFDNESTSTDGRWSLSVRLNSAVDLPSSIIPSMPLCPLMKFGLITVTEEDEVLDLEKSSAKSRRAEYEQESSSSAVMMDNSLQNDNEIGVVDASSTNDNNKKSQLNASFSTQQSLKIVTSSGKKGILASFQQKDSLEECVSKSAKPTKIQLTSGKIMSKKDNGMMEWNEEMRWDDIEMPLQAVLCVELSARAVFPPAIMSAMETLSGDFENVSFDANNNYFGASKEDGQTSSSSNGNNKGGLLGFWRKGRNNRKQKRGVSNISSNTSSYHGSDDSGVDVDDSNQKEMEKAAAAAAVARYLMECNSKSEEEEENVDEEKNEDHSSIDKQVRSSIQEGDIRLGTLLIPISNLPLEDEVPTVEKWFRFDSVAEGSKMKYENDASSPPKGPSFRSPSALLQISLSNPDILDELEEDVYLALDGDGDGQGEGAGRGEEMKLSIQSLRDRPISVDTSLRSRRGSADMEQVMKEEEMKLEEAAKILENGPILEPGLINHVCVVGPKVTGSRIDMSTRGWIEPEQESCILEQFPPEGFHHSHGRDVSLPNKVEWWCFPEGCKLWCGSEPPTHMDMNLKRFSASSPKTMASSIAAFDACLDCTSSFMWWVMSSNSDEYGSTAKKTYGAVIRFYAPVPNDPQSQKKYSRYPVGENDDTMNEAQYLWCPIGICMTSKLPIIGTMEALLLRLCERLSSNISSTNIVDKVFQRDVMNLILNFQSPIPGVINCSIPFLAGDVDRLLISLPPKDGLPPLPHGASVASVCRLLGAEGLNALLASVLTECKILIHSADVANLAMVAEVVTALIYPFEFQLPYVPVIPISLMEVLEAPVSYFVGVPTCNMNYIDKSVLADVVVIDLDNGFSTPDYFDGRRGAPSSRTTNPLPALVSSNISKAVFRLLRDEEEVEEQFGASNFSETRHLPRLDGESLAERNFRIAVAQQICSLIRGYQECLFFVSVSQPVFNRDRFLRQAPALFEERSIPSSSLDDDIPDNLSQRILSPRSKRFLSGLVNTQHFHDLLERLDNVETSFFHQIMDSFQQENHEQADSNQMHIFGTPQQNELTLKLSKILDGMENQIPVYHVHRGSSDTENDELQSQTDICMTSFTSMLLKPSKPPIQQVNDTENKHSLQQLLEIQESPWQYSQIFNIDLSMFGENNISETHKLRQTKWPRIHLKEAMGDRKFRVWKEQQEDKEGGAVETVKGRNREATSNTDKTMLDLLKLLPLDGEDRNHNSYTARRQRDTDNSINERDVVRRYIEKAYEAASESETMQPSFLINESGAEVEKAMSKPSAQRFLVSILSQRARLQNDRQHDFNGDSSISRIQPIVFECLVRLCNAMLEACIRDFDYESAYRLLTHSTGFCTMSSEDPQPSIDESSASTFLTKRIAVHPIFKDLRLWDRVVLLHKQDRQKDRSAVIERSMDSEVLENDEYEATVSTLYEMLGYGMPPDELAKFASRIATDKLFSTDSEQKVLMLSRKLALKCDDVDSLRDSMLVGRGRDFDNNVDTTSDLGEFKVEAQWEEVSWSHPVSTSSDDLNFGGGVDGYVGQSPITALASFGSSVVVSGALDGSVFVANTFGLESIDSWKSFNSSGNTVPGVRLEWQRNSYGSTNSTENVGAISCLATSKGFNYLSKRNAFDFNGNSDSDALLAAVAGCRIIGGTTSGDVRVWSLQDIYVNHVTHDNEDISSIMTESYASTQSNHIRSVSTQETIQSIEAKSGFSLGNHRGGVTCLSVPAQTYRPDSLVSGGNDGLIKLWSLRQSKSESISRRSSMGGRTSRMLFSGRESTSRRGALDSVDVLAGHGGRVLCLETAWHGDRLLSGAADLTLKLWDLSKSGSNCIQTMHGHTGWVTHSCFWGRNTAISASTDRSVAVWDTRTGNVPIFALRHHTSPISDLYIESRNSYWMTSAGAEGVVATWDCRKLSCTKDTMSMASQVTQTVRNPIAKMKHCQILQGGAESAGPVMLAKGVSTKYGQGDRTVMSVSTNGFINEWDVMSGRLLTEHDSKHCNAISCFKTYRDHENLLKGRRGFQSDNLCLLGGTITAAWDGKVKLRRMLLKKSDDR